MNNANINTFCAIVIAVVLVIAAIFDGVTL